MITENYIAAAENDPGCELPIQYTPVETWVNHAPDSVHTFRHQSVDVQKVVNLSQTVLARYDALHYWFADVKDADVTSSSEDLDVFDRAAQQIAKVLDTRTPYTLKYGEVPDWKMVRDNATFLAGPMVKNPHRFAGYIASQFGTSCVTLDMDKIHRRDGPCHYTAVHDLIQMEKEYTKIIEDKLCDTFTTREVLNYINSADSDEVTVRITGDGGVGNYITRKWKIESLWLTDHLLEHFPQFRCNFDTVIIIGAGKYINSDDINVNRLYRLFARLGRVNTHLVFVG